MHVHIRHRIVTFMVITFKRDFKRLQLLFGVVDSLVGVMLLTVKDRLSDYTFQLPVNGYDEVVWVFMHRCDS